MALDLLGNHAPTLMLPAIRHRRADDLLEHNIANPGPHLQPHRERAEVGQPQDERPAIPRIGFARQHYNDVVSQFNSSLQTFPTNVVGGMFGFHPAEFFKLDAAEAAAVQKAPQVKF